MNELKCFYATDGEVSENSVQSRFAYPKADVDKVLAKKDEQIRRQRHQRYIAMARWCKDMADWWDYEQVNRLHEQHGNAESLRFKMAHAKFCYYVKLEQIWQGLADKIKKA